MAIVENNDLTLGLRGKFGKHFVFRSLRGKTIASHAPRKPDPRMQTAAQRQTRATFREAAAWAIHTLRDPKQKKLFQDRAKELALPNAYTAAVRAYMRNTIETKEDKSACSVLQACKPVFWSMRNGKFLNRKPRQPAREARRPLESTSIRMPRGITQSRGQEINRTAAGNTLRAKERWLTPSKTHDEGGVIMPKWIRDVSMRFGETAVRPSGFYLRSNGVSGKPSFPTPIY